MNKDYLNWQNTRNYRATNPNFSAISFEFEECFSFEKELSYDKVSSCVNFLLQVFYIFFICGTLRMASRVSCHKNWLFIYILTSVMRVKILSSLLFVLFSFLFCSCSAYTYTVLVCPTCNTYYKVVSELFSDKLHKISCIIKSILWCFPLFIQWCICKQFGKTCWYLESFRFVWARPNWTLMKYKTQSWK